jgi:transposase
MAISDGHGLPLAIHVASASPYETTLVDATLDERFLADLPERLIGDKAYDSDPLDQHLHDTYGIELIAPHRSDRVNITQDGRALRRVKRRWKNRTPLRLVSQLPPLGHPLGTPRGQLPRDDSFGFRRNPPEGIYEIGSNRPPCRTRPSL